MGITLYDATVARFLQTLAATSHFMAKGLDHLAAAKIDPANVVQTRLFDDMLPFSFQIVSIAHHSLGAVEGVRRGAFAPPSRMTDMAYQDLQKLVSDAHAALEKLTSGEVNALAERDLVFTIGANNIPYVAQDFLLSFSLPNFFFHVTTAYDILRMKGAPLGKRDYLGRMQIKR